MIAEAVLEATGLPAIDDKWDPWPPEVKVAMEKILTILAGVGADEPDPDSNGAAT